MNSKELILKEGTSFHEMDTDDGICTISEIIIDANNHSDDLSYLNRLCNEVVRNKKQYPLVQINYMIEHFQELALQMARRDASFVKEFFAGSGIFD